MAREVIDIIIQERGGVRVERVIERIGNRAEGSQRQVSLLRRALGGLSAGFAIREVLRSVDAYQRLQNQLSIVASTSGELRILNQELFNIAQRTRQPLEQVGSLYGKLAQAGQELGGTQEQLLRFTELTGKALAIQGTTANGARGVLIQLSQAMGEGIVRAQEFNSLIENARPLLLAAATGIDEAGGSVNKLRQLVIAGELSSREFFDAVLEGGTILDEQFGRTTATVGQALTQLNNAWLNFIGTSGAGSVILKNVVGVLTLIVNNFDALAGVIITAGTAFAAYWGASALGSAIAAIRGAVVAQTALNVALGATGLSATRAAGALKLVQVGIRGVTAAIATNPIGALAVAITLAIGALFQLRNEMVEFGGVSASVGSIVMVIWQRIQEAVKAAVEFFADAFSSFAENALAGVNNVLGYFGDINVTAKDVGNFIIAVFKSGIDAIVTEFRVLYNVAIGVFRGIAASARGVFDGLAAAVSGDFSAAGEAFSNAFSGENFNFDGAITAAREGAEKIADNFSRDFLGEAGAAISPGVQSIFEEAAQRDLNIAEQLRLEEELRKLEKIKGQTNGLGGAAGGAAAELEGVAEQLKEITDGSVTTQMQELVDRTVALRQALASGTIGVQEYNLEQNALRLEAVELAAELNSVEQEVRRTNEAILQLALDSGTATFGDAFLLQLSRMTEGVNNFRASAGTVFGEFFESFTTGFSNSIGAAIVQSEDLGEALHNVASSALQSLISGLIQVGVQYLLNAALGQTLQAAATASSVAQAGVASAAWAPAAALASIATGGASAAAANASIASTIASTRSLATVGAFADGGLINAPGGPRDDKGLAAVSDGEFIVNARDTARNRPLLEAMNRGVDIMSRLPRFQDGGEYAGDVARKPQVIAQRAENDIQATTRAAARDRDTRPIEVDARPEVIVVRDQDEAQRYLQSANGRRTLVSVLGEEGVI